MIGDAHLNFRTFVKPEVRLHVCDIRIFNTSLLAELVLAMHEVSF